MRIEARNLSALHHDDTVGIHHALDALGNDELGYLGQLLAERSLNTCVGFRVAGTGGVVENQDLGFLQQGTGNAETLLLSTRHITAVLFQIGVVAIGHLLDELIGTSQPAHFLTFLQRGIFLSPAQVIKDGA